jgi:hypothetical protein
MHIFFTFIATITCHLAIYTYYWADTNFDVFASMQSWIPLVWDVALLPHFSKERIELILKKCKERLEDDNLFIENLWSHLPR